MKLTKTIVDMLPVPETGYKLYPDDELPGFGVYVTSTGVRTYYLERRIKGRKHRMKVCRSEEMAPEKARNHARTLVGEIIQGKDVIAEKKRKVIEAITLKEAVEDYVEKRRVKGGLKLKPRTKDDMLKACKRLLADWWEKPLTAITPDRVLTRHRELTDASPAQADLVMRYGQAVFEFWRVRNTDAEGNPIIANNPFGRISAVKQWNKVKRRKTRLKKPEFPVWYEAVSALPHNAKNYLLLILLTGLRATEAGTLTWSNVDFEAKTILIPDTKNRRPHTLPLSDFLVEILEEQKRHAEGSIYVFPGRHGKEHIKSVQTLTDKIAKDTGVKFCRHDLRRTFETVAESIDIPYYALKALLNHSTEDDVTAGYLDIESERLRIPMQRITDHILTLCGAKGGAQVIPLDRRA